VCGHFISGQGHFISGNGHFISGRGQLISGLYHFILGFIRFIAECGHFVFGFGHLIGRWVFQLLRWGIGLTFDNISSKRLRAIFYQGKRKLETGYEPWQTTETLIGYIVCYPM
jgi:hypothetical protein